MQKKTLLFRTNSWIKLKSLLRHLIKLVRLQQFYNLDSNEKTEESLISLDTVNLTLNKIQSSTLELTELGKLDSDLRMEIAITNEPPLNLIGKEKALGEIEKLGEYIDVRID
uniref:Uncharacterized protein n=1 Tax=Trichogramma kaykai TaxID=54128 RepID=A0ABD2WQR9_9HYME